MIQKEGIPHMKAVELRKKTCCFTGHRDIPIDRTQEIAKRTANEIRRLIVNRGVCFFGVGSAYCITYCARNYGGTAYTVRYARQQGLEVRNIVLYNVQ